MSQTYQFERAYIGGAWYEDVVMSVEADGSIGSLSHPDEDAAAPGGRDSGPSKNTSSGHGAHPEPDQYVRGWALPGLSNVHSHAFQRGLVGRAERGGTDSFWRWREVMYEYVDRLTPEIVESTAAQLYMEMLRGGFTSVAEFHYVHHQAGGQAYEDPAELSRRVIAAAHDAGINLVHIPVVYHQAGFDGRPLEPSQQRFALTVDDLAVLAGSLEAEAQPGPGSRVSLGWGIHSLRACSEPEMERAVALFDEQPRRPVHIHVAEQPLEVEGCLAHRGARPVEWLTDHAPLDQRWCLVHATWTSEDEVSRMCRAEVVAGLCPTTEANLGDGVFPLPHHLDQGGRLGVGTDSHVTSLATSELRMLEYGQRLHHTARGITIPGPGRPDSGVGAALVSRALSGGAQALGIPCGALTSGQRADVVVLDGEHPALLGHGPDTVLDAWVFSDHGNPVRDVMVGGRWVVSDGRHRHEDAITRRFGESLT